MKRRSWAATVAGCALVVAIATIGFTGAASARPTPTVAKHSYVNNSGAVMHGTAVAIPKKYRALVKRTFARARSLQAAGASQTCLGGTKLSDTSAVQTCQVTGSAGACIQISSDPGATQTCNFTQSPGRTNLAIVAQIIVQRSGAAVASQNGSQTANVQQQNMTKPNLSFVVQIIKQSLGRGSDNYDSEVTDYAPVESSAESQGVLPNFAPLIGSLVAAETAQEGPESTTTPTSGPDVQQSQQSQQIANICQGGTGDTIAGTCRAASDMFSSNLSSVYQSLRQRERWANANTVLQQQNPATGSCPRAAFDGNTTNMCAIVDQNTTGGKNLSGLAELYRQFQSVINANSTTQQQDPAPFVGGLDHDIHQLSVGDPAGPKRNTIRTFQLGRQVQQANNAGALTQVQDPVGRKGEGSSQNGTAADTWDGSLRGTQLQFADGVFATGGVQSQDLTYQGTSTGTINATVTGTQNGSTDTEACSGTGFCQIGVTCASGGESEIGGCVPHDFGEIELSRR